MQQTKPIWLKRGSDLTERERRLMCVYSRRRVARFGRIPEAAEWAEQMATIDADYRAERA